jgi:hypothetical protein
VHADVARAADLAEGQRPGRVSPVLDHEVGLAQLLGLQAIGRRVGLRLPGAAAPAFRGAQSR